MRKNINLLPSIYKNGEVVKKIMDILDVEFNDLRHHAETLGDQLNIKSVTWGADTWENELDIQYNPSISLDDRREIILAKVRGRGSTTKAMIKNTAESLKFLL